MNTMNKILDSIDKMNNLNFKLTTNEYPKIKNIKFWSILDESNKRSFDIEYENAVSLLIDKLFKIIEKRKFVNESLELQLFELKKQKDRIYHDRKVLIEEKRKLLEKRKSLLTKTYGYVAKPADN